MNGRRGHRGTFLVRTLGCKVNRCESDALESDLSRRGWRRARKGEPVQLIVVNTCSVTGRGAQQSRQTVRRLLRDHPGARMVVTGCHAQVAGEEFRAIPGVTDVVGWAGKQGIPERVAVIGAGPEGEAVGEAPRPPFYPRQAAARSRLTRPVLKVQDGCDSFCSYCIVPHARGPSRSLPAGQVLDAVEGLAAAGAREVVLSGIHLGRWGLDLRPPEELADLLERLDAVRPVERIRLSSIEPNELTGRLLERVSTSPLFCRHLHIPLQSGSDAILERMNRRYGAADFATRVMAAFEAMPDVSIGADVLVGFPGETEAHHRATVDLVRQLPLSYLHVFPFSPRPGTPAAGFSGRVGDEAMRRRCRELRRLGERKGLDFASRWAGATLEVLVEDGRDRGTGRLRSMASPYLTVLVDGPDTLKNRILSVRTDPRPFGNRLLGTVVPG
jgi:threonylcarbamoyladenosine tRNA methylthiotransferase MtaB